MILNVGPCSTVQVQYLCQGVPVGSAAIVACGRTGCGLFALGDHARFSQRPRSLQYRLEPLVQVLYLVSTTCPNLSSRNCDCLESCCKTGRLRRPSLSAPGAVWVYQRLYCCWSTISPKNQFYPKRAQLRPFCVYLNFHTRIG